MIISQTLEFEPFGAEDEKSHVMLLRPAVGAVEAVRKALGSPRSVAWHTRSQSLPMFQSVFVWTAMVPKHECRGLSITRRCAVVVLRQAKLGDRYSRGGRSYQYS